MSKVGRLNPTGIGKGGAASIHALVSSGLGSFPLSSTPGSCPSHTQFYEPKTLPILVPFSGLGCFIVPGGRVLAERTPHANPVTGRCREAGWQQQGGQRAPEAASGICQQVCLCRVLASLPAPGVLSLNKSALTHRKGKLF